MTPSYTPPCVLDTPEKVRIANANRPLEGSTLWKLGDKCWYWGEMDAPWVREE